MLTVKHLDTDGSEYLMEANKVDVVRGKGRFDDGIFLDRTPAGFAHVIHFAEACSANQTAPRVFVMNRFGATVAQYNL